MENGKIFKRACGLEIVLLKIGLQHMVCYKVDKLCASKSEVGQRGGKEDFQDGQRNID